VATAAQLLTLRLILSVAIHMGCANWMVRVTRPINSVLGTQMKFNYKIAFVVFVLGSILSLLIPRVFIDNEFATSDGSMVSILMSRDECVISAISRENEKHYDDKNIHSI
jgi:hypothetical protein